MYINVGLLAQKLGLNWGASVNVDGARKKIQNSDFQLHLPAP